MHLLIDRGTEQLAFTSCVFKDCNIDKLEPVLSIITGGGKWAWSVLLHDGATSEFIDTKSVHCYDTNKTGHCN
jgi:hypothetical protein